MIKWFERHNLISWIITIVIGILIFYFSSITFKGGTGTGASTNAIVYHFMAFFFFGLFLLISIVKGKRKFLLFFTGILLAVSYGILDEIHQFFVPGRFCSVGDAIWDTVGILTAFLIYLVLIYIDMIRKKN